MERTARRVAVGRRVRHRAAHVRAAQLLFEQPPALVSDDDAPVTARRESQDGPGGPAGEARLLEPGRRRGGRSAGCAIVGRGVGRALDLQPVRDLRGQRCPGHGARRDRPLPERVPSASRRELHAAPVFVLRSRRGAASVPRGRRASTRSWSANRRSSVRSRMRSRRRPSVAAPARFCESCSTGRSTSASACAAKLPSAKARSRSATPRCSWRKRSSAAWTVAVCSSSAPVKSARSTAQHLRAQGVAEVAITSRTAAHAQALATEVGGHWVPWEGLAERARQCRHHRDRHRLAAADHHQGAHRVGARTASRSAVHHRRGGAPRRRGLRQRDRAGVPLQRRRPPVDRSGEHLEADDRDRACRSDRPRGAGPVRRLAEVTWRDSDRRGAARSIRRHPPGGAAAARPEARRAAARDARRCSISSRD